MAISHTNCAHPSTKAARAKCRKANAAQANAEMDIRKENTDALNAVIDTYYDNSGDLEEIAAQINRLAAITRNPTLILASEGYYDGSLTAEEFIALANSARTDLPNDAPANEIPAPAETPMPPMIKISGRYRQETGRSRGIPGPNGRKSDTHYSFSRRIAGTEFNFAITRFEGGKGGSMIIVRNASTGEFIHEFRRTRTETFAHHNRRR